MKKEYQNYGENYVMGNHVILGSPQQMLLGPQIH
jgi:hypothetical protein